MGTARLVGLTGGGGAGWARWLHDHVNALDAAANCALKREHALPRQKPREQRVHAV